MRTDVTINLSGHDLAGWLYLPPTQRPHPLIVMSHGFGAIKEMGLHEVAVAFVAAGFACLVYDHRNTGASGGALRGELDPWEQIADMRDVITYASALPAVDAARIGLWGTSYAGGHAIVVAAVDRRVACVVSQVPTVSGYKNTVRSMPADRHAAFLGELHEDRLARARGEPPRYVPISTEGSDSFAWSRVAGAGTAYVNAVTLRSRDLRMAYEPGAWLPRIAPTPLLMIVATSDTRCPTDDQLAAFSTAHEPKSLLLIPGGHYVVYTSARERTTRASIEWFSAHLATPS
ncbi:alpha/beta hydrolase [soil metagenome]